MISHDFFEDMTGETKINTAKCTTGATSHTKVLLNEFVKVLVKNSQIFLRNSFCLYWVCPLGILCLNVCSEWPHNELYVIECWRFSKSRVRKKKTLGCVRAYMWWIVGSTSLVFFFRSNHSWCFTCKPWLRTFEKRQVADFCWTYNESIEVGPHKSCWKNISKSRMFRKWWLHVITLQFFLYFHMCFDTFTTWSSKSTTIQRSRSIGRLRRWGKNWGENRPVDELLIEKPSKVEVPLPPNPCQKQTY